MKSTRTSKRNAPATFAEVVKLAGPEPTLAEIRERDAAKASIYAAMDAREQARGGRLTF